MVEPAQIGAFFTIFFSAAMVVVLGALYALLLALSRLKALPALLPLAHLAYAGLFVATVLLARATNLFASVFWAVTVTALLVGYWFAPRLIWHLCARTHAAQDGLERSGARGE